MPRVEVFPHKAAVVSAKGINFEQVSLTVRNVSVAKDGTSKAGREYHLPPRIQFAEDPSGEDWMWKEWNDTSESFQDYSGVLPVAGDVVQVKLKVSYKGGEDSGEYYRDVHDLYLSMGGTAATPQPDAQGAAPPATGGSNLSALGRLSLDEKISAVAMSNVMLHQVWMEEPDGEPWKEMIRSAVKKISQAQIPPSLLGIAKAGAAESAPEPEVEAPPVEAAAPPQAEDVTELPW
jgi:hypothetical protein|tara:strand:+ start:2566 stop:3267 length:702 start_codon:yes stop_codon:yes gene_type:complete